MNQISQQVLISGTLLFLLSLLVGFGIPALANPRMGVSVHVAGIESGIALWALGLMWSRMALPEGAQLAVKWLAVPGFYAIFISLLLAALWGTSRATPIVGVGHQAGRLREVIVTVVLSSGSVATLVATAIVLWGLSAWRG
jgi:(hydroxyamino)benzene mutase